MPTTYEDAKQEVMTLPQAVVMAPRVAVLADRIRAAAGYVVWDETIPRGSTAVAHNYSFLQAVYTALSFVHAAAGTMVQNEWMVLGLAAYIPLRMIHFFQPVMPVRCHLTPLWYVGMVQTVTVYINPNMQRKEWMVGGMAVGVPDTDLCCRGNCTQGGAVFNDQGDPINP